ncbi:Ribose import ATP-binding protein RbsA [Posidoniimonas polymericola]|uniref:Ribose import ATP-binding protein RbsA n=1 Tax=Posidoniimonas polymericola TaxID=2528002 RepID=A0A5C5YTN9_9BACT|nr:sugar ABC transporter ATP-binding protein [Posidoniimonas polymericola]TWT78345.1 Ribose import ATP-binding protein RbsA [Posidoniimonas polymericola]
MRTPLPTEPPLLEMIGISKRFGPVEVLRGVDFTLNAGEVHVLAGENGAGKSTLIKILAGVHDDYRGSVRVEGRDVRFRTPREAVDGGVAVIHQELSLIGPMTIADNLFLGRAKTFGGFVRSRLQSERSREWLERLSIEASPGDRVEDLAISTQQRLEIAKALSLNAKILVMDEPTSSLNSQEVEKLFELIAELRSRGVGIVYISHKMDEITRIADRVTVLRDGRLVASAPAAEAPATQLIYWMVGRDVEQQDRPPRQAASDVRLEARGFSLPGPAGAPGPVDSVSFSVRRGEVVGVGGLQGSGASELLLGLFGAAPRIEGGVWIDGAPVRIRNPRQAIRQGVALLTADRKSNGLVLSMSITKNTTLASLGAFSSNGWLRPERERRAAACHAEALHLNAERLEMEVGALSGGNQQKVALAKWLETRPRVLLLDEPTRGVDVGAKREIYDLIDQWAAGGMAIVLISTEMPELLSLSDRIVVLHRGRVTATLDRGVATAETVLAAAMGSHQENPAPLIDD